MYISSYYLADCISSNGNKYPLTPVVYRNCSKKHRILNVRIRIVHLLTAALVIEVIFCMKFFE